MNSDRCVLKTQVMAPDICVEMSSYDLGLVCVAVTTPDSCVLK